MSAIKERPILFSGAMVRAILDGQKTQTRSVVKPQPIQGTTSVEFNTAEMAFVPWKNVGITGTGWARTGRPLPCPYGQPGDRLWVRETWRLSQGITGPQEDKQKERFYLADFGADPKQYARYKKEKGPWSPPVTMPRWASRLTLEVVSVRVERLQDISVDDVYAEGTIPTGVRREPMMSGEYREYPVIGASIARKNFIADWEREHGPDSWAKNPWVWVVEFKQVTP